MFQPRETGSNSHVCNVHTCLNVSKGTHNTSLYHEACFSRVSDLAEKGKVICNIYAYFQKQLIKDGTTTSPLSCILNTSGLSQTMLTAVPVSSYTLEETVKGRWGICQASQLLLQHLHVHVVSCKQILNISVLSPKFCGLQTHSRSQHMLVSATYPTLTVSIVVAVIAMYGEWYVSLAIESFQLWPCNTLSRLMLNWQVWCWRHGSLWVVCFVWDHFNTNVVYYSKWKASTHTLVSV